MELLVQDLIVNSPMAHELVLVRYLPAILYWTHCWLVRNDCFEFLRYVCFATLPSHCYSLHYLEQVYIVFPGLY